MLLNTSDDDIFTAVVPDLELYHIVLNVFGERSVVMKKLKRMNYWLPKFRNVNPYPIPFILPKDPTENAKLALARMCPDVRKEVTTFQVMIVYGACSVSMGVNLPFCSIISPGKNSVFE